MKGMGKKHVDIQLILIWNKSTFHRTPTNPNSYPLPAEKTGHVLASTWCIHHCGTLLCIASLGFTSQIGRDKMWICFFLNKKCCKLMGSEIPSRTNHPNICEKPVVNGMGYVFTNHISTGGLFLRPKSFRAADVVGSLWVTWALICFNEKLPKENIWGLRKKRIFGGWFKKPC